MNNCTMRIDDSVNVITVVESLPEGILGGGDTADKSGSGLDLVLYKGMRRIFIWSAAYSRSPLLFECIIGISSLAMPWHIKRFCYFDGQSQPDSHAHMSGQDLPVDTACSVMASVKPTHCSKTGSDYHAHSGCS
jgi:hypothetical protein